MLLVINGKKRPYLGVGFTGIFVFAVAFTVFPLLVGNILVIHEANTTKGAGQKTLLARSRVQGNSFIPHHWVISAHLPSPPYGVCSTLRATLNHSIGHRQEKVHREPKERINHPTTYRLTLSSPPLTGRGFPRQNC